jgi:hypothetical protein
MESFPERIRKGWTALVTGEGRVLPIVEKVGRRVIREIDPGSAEGSRLLAQGKVDLWSDLGVRIDPGGEPRRLSVDRRALRRLPSRTPADS